MKSYEIRQCKQVSFEYENKKDSENGISIKKSVNINSNFINKLTEIDQHKFGIIDKLHREYKIIFDCQLHNLMLK